MGAGAQLAARLLMQIPFRFRGFHVEEQPIESRVGEDLPLLNSNHFRPGIVTQSNRTLARLSQYLRDCLRCHASAEFIV